MTTSTYRHSDRGVRCLETSRRSGAAVGRCRVCGALVSIALSVAPAAAQQLLDRVVARVNGVAITMTDARAALGLGVVDVPPGASESAVIEAVIDRQLMLSEVTRFAPAEPPAADVDRQAKALAARAGARLPELMASTGIDEARIREIARETLRIEAYLDQRFGIAAQLTEEEVVQYYRIHPEEFTRGGVLMPFVEAAPRARELAGAERRALAVAQWLRDLRGRAEIARPPQR